MEFLKKHRRVISAIAVIIVIIIILLSIKSCSSSGETYTEVEPYKEHVAELNKENEKTVDNFLTFIADYQYSSGTLPTTGSSELDEEVFVCDENTAEVYDRFGEAFTQKAEEYFRLKYIGKEYYADQAYFDLLFNHYQGLGQTLKGMAENMRSKNTDEVLSGFDNILLIM